MCVCFGFTDRNFNVLVHPYQHQYQPKLLPGTVTVFHFALDSSIYLNFSIFLTEFIFMHTLHLEKEW